MNDAPHHDQLPLPDYDELPLGSIESRIRSLDADGVEALLAYEHAHGNRLPVVTVLEHRLEELRRGEAEPTGGNPLEVKPEVQHQPQARSPASPEKQGPPINPPPHGVYPPARG